MVRAARLVGEQEGQEGSGESKRHQVYARLLKEFPTRPKREAALAIEQARWGIVVPGDVKGLAALEDLQDEVALLQRRVRQETSRAQEAETVAESATTRADAVARQEFGRMIREEVETG